MVHLQERRSRSCPPNLSAAVSSLSEESAEGQRIIDIAKNMDVGPAQVRGPTSPTSPTSYASSLLRIRLRFGVDMHPRRNCASEQRQRWLNKPIKSDGKSVSRYWRNHRMILFSQSFLQSHIPPSFFLLPLPDCSRQLLPIMLSASTDVRQQGL